ncbi:MAG: Snf7 family protein [Sulfolobales archaeon]|nr:Snf7 family protein [Sulfolobales archaeon]MCG2908074.1 Snf7 family protein [Sulfolobales archaeon]
MFDKLWDNDDNIWRKLWPFSNNRGSKNLKDKIGDLVFKIREHETKLEELIVQMKRRGKDLFDAVVRAQRENDTGRAAIYAQEVANVRKIINALTTAKLVLEKARIRLETVRDLAEAGYTLQLLADAFKAIRDEIRPIAPNIAISLDTLVSSVNAMSSETSTLGGVVSNYQPVITEEAKRILEEARKESNEKVSKEFPDLPSEVLYGFPHPPGTPSTEASVKIPEPSTPSRLKDALYNIILQTNGVVDLNYVSSRLKVSKEEVYNALLELAKEGKVAIDT